MPPLAGASKSKGKNREARRSRSRNTTPSSVLSVGTAAAGPTTTPLLELELNKLIVSPKPNYSDIIDYLESHGTKFEPKSLHDIIDQLKHLSDSAENRAESCEKAIRLIHEQKKELESDQQDRERQAEQARRAKTRKDESHSRKNPKAKKRKDRPETFDSVEIKREGMFYHLLSTTPTVINTTGYSSDFGSATWHERVMIVLGSVLKGHLRPILPGSTLSPSSRVHYGC